MGISFSDLSVDWPLAERSAPAAAAAMAAARCRNLRRSCPLALMFSSLNDHRRAGERRDLRVLKTQKNSMRLPQRVHHQSFETPQESSAGVQRKKWKLAKGSSNSGWSFAKRSFDTEEQLTEFKKNSHQEFRKGQSAAASAGEPA